MWALGVWPSAIEFFHFYSKAEKANSKLTVSIMKSEGREELHELLGCLCSLLIRVPSYV